MYERKKNSMIPVIAITIVIGVILLSLKAFLMIPPIVDKMVELENRDHVSDVVSRVYLDIDDFLKHIEEETGYSFPEKAVKNFENSFSFKCSSYHNTIDYFSVLHFDELSEDELYEFEASLESDPYFRSSLGDMKKIVDVNGGEVLDEYKLVYVMDTYLFNTLPKKQGEYRLITMFYDIDFKSLMIEEYTTNYFIAPY